MPDNKAVTTARDSMVWAAGAINALVDGAKDSIISSTKDAMQVSKKGDSPGPIAEPPKVSLQPMSEIVSATGGSGSYLQMAATTAETIKAVLASHKTTLEDTHDHLHDPKGEAPEAMSEEIQMMLKGLCASMKALKLHHDKPTGVQIVGDSQMRIHSPSLDVGGQNVSIAGTHGQLSFETHSNASKCAFNWHQVSMHDVKFVHQNYEVRNAVVGTDSKSGVSSREYFNEVSTDAAYSISNTTKLHSIQASDIEEKASNITSRAIKVQDVQAGQGYTLSVGQGTAKGEAPHFFMAGGLGAKVSQQVLQIGLSSIGGGGILGGLIGNPTPGVVIKHTPNGSSVVSPKMTNLLGSDITNITGMARRVVHGEAINIANGLLADVSKGIKLEGVAGGVLTMLTKKFSISMSGWMTDLITKVIDEVIGCIEFPELPKLPEVTLPRVPQISCMPPGSSTDTMKKPPSNGTTASPLSWTQSATSDGKGGATQDGNKDGDSHQQGVHTERYPVWVEDKDKGMGIPGKVSTNQEGVRGTESSLAYAPSDSLVATFGAPLMVYKSRAPMLGKGGSPSSTSSTPIDKGTPPGGKVDTEMKLNGVPDWAQSIIRDYANGNISKAEASSKASSMGINITPYMDRSNFPATTADILGVGGVANSKANPSLEKVISIMGSGKSMAVGDVLEAVLGQIPGVKGDSISLKDALNDMGMSKAVGKDGTLESAELLSIVMERAGLHLPEGLMTVDKDKVHLDVDKVMDKAIDKAISFLGSTDPILKVDRLLKLVGAGTPLTNLLNDLAACAKSWINIRAILKLPDIALDSISGKIGKITLPGIDLDFLKGWSLCGTANKAGPIKWDGVKEGQGGYNGTITDGSQSA